MFKCVIDWCVNGLFDCLFLFCSVVFVLIFFCFVLNGGIKPCLTAVGVGASPRFWLPHLNNDTDGRRSIIGCGASTSHCGNVSDIEAPIGPQRGSEKMRLVGFFCIYYLTTIRFIYWTRRIQRRNATKKTFYFFESILQNVSTVLGSTM